MSSVSASSSSVADTLAATLASSSSSATTSLVATASIVAVESSATVIKGPPQDTDRPLEGVFRETVASDPKTQPAEKPLPPPIPAEKVAEITPPPPQENYFTKIQNGVDWIEKTLKIDWLDRQVENLTSSLPESIRGILMLLWKIKFVVALLFLAPTILVWVGFGVTCAVSLLYPKSLEGSEKLRETLRVAVGVYSVVQTIMSLLSASIIATIINAAIAVFCLKGIRDEIAPAISGTTDKKDEKKPEEKKEEKKADATVTTTTPTTTNVVVVETAAADIHANPPSAPPTLSR